MVANPMQRKARNSFLLGMTITLVICIIIGVVVYVMLSGKEKKKEQEEGVLTYAYRLKTNVRSGEEITIDKVEAILVTEKAVPAGAFASKTKTKNSKGKEEWTNKAFPSGYKSKVDLNAGTILANNLVYAEEELTNDFANLFEENDRIVNRSIMCKTLAGMPIFLNSQQEIKEYFDYVLESCKDASELTACNKLVCELIEEER